jgi:hypothetical protein
MVSYAAFALKMKTAPNIGAAIGKTFFVGSY